MEIERKYLIHKLPENLDTYPYKKSNRHTYAPNLWFAYANRMRNTS